MYKGKKRHMKKKTQVAQVVLIKPFMRSDSEDEDSLSLNDYSSNSRSVINDRNQKSYKPKDSSSNYDR